MSEKLDALRELVDQTILLNKCGKLILKLSKEKSSDTSLFPDYVYQSRKLIMEMREAGMVTTKKI